MRGGHHHRFPSGVPALAELVPDRLASGAWGGNARDLNVSGAGDLSGPPPSIPSARSGAGGGKAGDEVSLVGGQVREGGETVEAEAGIAIRVRDGARRLEDRCHQSLKGAQG